MGKEFEKNRYRYMYNCYNWGFPGGSDSKVSACNAGDVGSIPGSGRSPGEGNGNPLQYSCLKIPWMEEPGGYNPQACKKSDTTERLHIHITDITGASSCNAGDLGSIPGLGRSPGEGNGNPLQYSGLKNSMDCTVHGVTKVRHD